ncbi:hypothetical protein GCM10009546_29480 [Actinomadura livida]|uniref:Uncharacterized protein n=1 Tax=Actinomadura livida TaxID=79909 RepID=A0ABN1EF30_9ACTN|nr:hypothetical protein GCM10010208_33700 [Actinomadura livida]
MASEQRVAGSRNRLDDRYPTITPAVAGLPVDVRVVPGVSSQIRKVIYTTNRSRASTPGSAWSPADVGVSPPSRARSSALPGASAPPHKKQPNVTGKPRMEASLNALLFARR